MSQLVAGARVAIGLPSLEAWVCLSERSQLASTHAEDLSAWIVAETLSIDHVALISELHREVPRPVAPIIVLVAAVTMPKRLWLFVLLLVIIAEALMNHIARIDLLPAVDARRVPHDALTLNLQKVCRHLEVIELLALASHEVRVVQQDSLYLTQGRVRKVLPSLIVGRLLDGNLLMLVNVGHRLELSVVNTVLRVPSAQLLVASLFLWVELDDARLLTHVQALASVVTDLGALDSNNVALANFKLVSQRAPERRHQADAIIIAESDLTTVTELA